MRTFCTFPPPSLAPYIDRFWGWEADDSETIALPTVLPGTGAELYIHYATPFHYNASTSTTAFSSSHLLCVRRRPIELADSAGIGFIAVRFRAGAVHCFTRMPAADIIDNAPTLGDIWGRAGTALAGNVCKASTRQERVRLLIAFLIGQLNCTAAHHLGLRASERLYQSSGFIKVAQLADELGITARQLERRVQQITGLSPVELKRLGRFQRTTKSLLLASQANSLETALAHGYYDQSHFIREFKAMTSMAPHAFLKRAKARSHFYNTSRPSSVKL